MLILNTGTELVDIATGEVVNGGSTTPPPTAPTNTATPTISPTQVEGVPVGTLLTMSDGAWQGIPAPAFTRRWLRGGIAIPDATGTTYRTTSADVDKVIRGEVTATATNAAGSTSTTVLTSNTVKPTAVDSGTFSQIAVQGGDEFRSLGGIRTFGGRAVGVYSELDDSAAAFKYLTDLKPYAVTHIITPGWTARAKSQTAKMAAAGIKSVLTVGEPHVAYNNAQWDDMIAEITLVGDHLLMVNGQNEINHVRAGTRDANNNLITLSPNWAANSAAHQRELWNRMIPVNAARQAAGKSRILVGSANLWSGNPATHHADLAEVAPLMRNYCDVACFHLYPRGQHPDWSLDEFIGQYRSAANYGAGKALWCTEAGYLDAANYVGNAGAITRATKAIYHKKQLLEYAVRGIPLSIFELMDDPDSTESERESNLGIIEVSPSTIAVSGWAVKPSYTNLQAMWSRAGGSSGTTPCNLVVPTGVRWWAVRDATGTTLYLWRPDDIEANRQPLTLNPLTRPVTVESPNHPLATYNVGKDVVEVRI